MRSSRPDVRNPLLKIPSARRLGEWLDASSAFVLSSFMRDLARDAGARAQESWKDHKAPMALYWKVVAVYARHLALILRSVSRDADRAAVPGRILVYQRALEEIGKHGDIHSSAIAQLALHQAREEKL